MELLSNQIIRSTARKVQLQSSRTDHPAAAPGALRAALTLSGPQGPEPGHTEHPRGQPCSAATAGPGRTRESRAAPPAQSEHARPQGPGTASSARRSPAPSAGAAPALPPRPSAGGPAPHRSPCPSVLREGPSGGLRRARGAAAGRVAGPGGPGDVGSTGVRLGARLWSPGRQRCCPGVSAGRHRPDPARVPRPGPGRGVRPCASQVHRLAWSKHSPFQFEWSLSIK